MTGVFVDGRELSAAEVAAMDSKIERVREDVQAGRPEVGALRPVDPYDLAAYKRDVLKRRDLDVDGYWAQVMTFWGFTWLEPAELDRVVGKQQIIPSRINGLIGEKIHDQYGREIPNTNLYWTKSHELGQWRSDQGTRRPPRELLGIDGRAMAFTMEDLVGNFGSPQAFDDWAKDRVRKTKIALARRASQRR